jgi:predicted deacetylase
MGAPLVVSVSGITAATLPHGAGLAAELDQRNVPLSLLVAPRPGRERPCAAVLSWVADRARGGDAVVLHGYDHDANPCRLAAVVPRPRAEFAALPAHEAGLRLLAARRLLREFGLATECFAAPRWRASRGTLAALRRHGFAVCADADAVRDLYTGAEVRARVSAYGGPAGGEAAEPWWCRALVLGVARAARRGRPVRIAVDAADLARPGPRRAVLDAVDIALHHGTEPTTYAAFGPRRLPPTGVAAGYTSAGSPRWSTRTVVPSGASRSNNP